MAQEDGHEKSVLLIEASSYYARLLGSWASEQGYTNVRLAADTQRAWSMLLVERFDLIVCDRNVGPDDGLELTRQLRLARDNPNRYSPLVLMASASTQRLVETARDCGINEFLAKPISKKAFVERLQAIAVKPRNFIKAGVFFGPDRRRRPADYQGEDRRKRAAEKVSKDDDIVLI